MFTPGHMPQWAASRLTVILLALVGIVHVHGEANTAHQDEDQEASMASMYEDAGNLHLQSPAGGDVLLNGQSFADLVSSTRLVGTSVCACAVCLQRLMAQARRCVCACVRARVSKYW